MTHNDSESFEYSTWSNIKSRCYNPNHESYPTYGGAGVKMCSAWLNSYESFLKDMGRRPSKAHSIDRIKNSGDYSPENCKWSTRTEQNRNRTNNRMITSGGITLSVAEWSERLGITNSAIFSRLNRGVDMSKLLIPMRKTKRDKQLEDCIISLLKYAPPESQEVADAAKILGIQQIKKGEVKV